jgi:ribosomal protein S8
MLTKIKNAQLSKKLFVVEEKIKNCEKCLKLLWKNGFILGYKNINGKLIVFLKYISSKPAINFFRIPRKQNKKIYLSVKQLWKLRMNNNTLCVIATSKGLKSLKECKKEKIGGKLMVIIS